MLHIHSTSTAPQQNPPHLPPPTPFFSHAGFQLAAARPKDFHGDQMARMEANQTSSWTRPPSKSLRHEEKDAADQQHRVAHADERDGARGVAVVEVGAEAHAYESGAGSCKVVDPVPGHVVSLGRGC